MKDQRPIAVVLLSGGMDSCVTAAGVRREFRVAALHADYGQRTETREREAFRALSRHFEAEYQLEVRLDYFGPIGGSSLTDRDLPVPDADLGNREIPSTYVPFRNAHFLSIAVSWAEVIGARRVFVGAVGEDSSGYPDCRPEYYDAFNRLVEAGTRPGSGIKIEAPLIYRRKSEIVKLGVEQGAPFDLTWSCYRREDLACGTCDSCALRLRGFREAGMEDPLQYVVRPDYT